MGDQVGIVFLWCVLFMIACAIIFMEHVGSEFTQKSCQGTWTPTPDLVVNRDVPQNRNCIEGTIRIWSRWPPDTSCIPQLTDWQKTQAKVIAYAWLGLAPYCLTRRPICRPGTIVLTSALHIEALYFTVTIMRSPAPAPSETLDNDPKNVFGIEENSEGLVNDSLMFWTPVYFT